MQIWYDEILDYLKLHGFSTRAIPRYAQSQALLSISTIPSNPSLSCSSKVFNTVESRSSTPTGTDLSLIYRGITISDFVKPSHANHELSPFQRGASTCMEWGKGKERKRGHTNMTRISLYIRNHQRLIFRKWITANPSRGWYWYWKASWTTIIWS